MLMMQDHLRKKCTVSLQRRNLLPYPQSISRKAVVTQNIEIFPFPRDIIWKSPGFFSLTVPYDHTRDFFYSGHTGILVVVFCELYTLGLKKAALICGMCICYIIILLLSTQVHYTTDVFAGFIMGLYVHGMVNQYIYYIDYFLTLPVFAAKAVYSKFRAQRN